MQRHGPIEQKTEARLTQPEVLGPRPSHARVFVVLMAITLAANSTVLAAARPPPGFDPTHDVWPTAVPPATCRTSDRVETSLQGEVPAQDRESGRSAQGYNCNIDLVGQYQGAGATYTSTSYKNCVYVGSTFPHTAGVEVVDASDPAHPVETDTLTEPAMIDGTWESLKADSTRGLLVGTGVSIGMGYGKISIYDIAQDCTHPRLLNTGAGSVPGMRVHILTHEGNFSPDANTYWASSPMGWVSAIDISDPTQPRIAWSAPTGMTSHGMGFTPDGRTMFMSQLEGLTVLDVSAIQDRTPETPTMHQLVPGLGHKFWMDGQGSQHNIYVTYQGAPFVFNVDELGSGGVKLFDVSQPSNPLLRNVIKLAVNLPGNVDRMASSAARSGVFGYDSHYCSIDRPTDPRALACGWTQAGIRVFDVRDPDHFREIAYFNPPAQEGKQNELTNSIHAILNKFIAPPLAGSFGIARAVLNGQASWPGIWSDPRRLTHGDLTADWCMSPPEFRGNMLFVTCSDNGFMALRIDPSVYPPR